MLLELVREVLGRRERQTRRDDTLDRGVVGEVKEEGDAVERAILFKVLLKEASRFHIHTHGSEHDRKVVLMVVVHALGGFLDQAGLTTNLGGDFIVRKTRGREDRDLLTTSNRVHCVNRGDTRLNHFLRICA